MADWFAQNAPAPSSGDWFAANAPTISAASTPVPGMERLGTLPGTTMPAPLPSQLQPPVGTVATAFRKAQNLAQAHPYITAAASLFPGGAPVAEALAPGTSDQVARGSLKTLASDAAAVLRRGTGPIGQAAGYLADKTGISDKFDAATQPQGPGEQVGHYATMAAEAGLPIPGAVDAIPNAERAGRNFQAVMQAAKDVPVDLAAASTPALKAQELREAGASMPSVVNKFLQRTTAPGGEPLTYDQSRLFASNAGRLSADEASRMIPPMKAQVAGLAKALNDANAAAAEQAGVGQLYTDAVNEYRQAMKLKGAKEAALEIAKEVAKKAVLGAGFGLGGYAVYKAIGEL